MKSQDNFPFGLSVTPCPLQPLKHLQDMRGQLTLPEKMRQTPSPPHSLSLFGKISGETSCPVRGHCHGNGARHVSAQAGVLVHSSDNQLARLRFGSIWRRLPQLRNAFISMDSVDTRICFPLAD